MEDSFNEKQSLELIAGIPLQYHLHLISMAVLLAFIIPGFYLRNKYLNDSNLLPKN